MAANLAICGGKRTVPDGLIQPWPQVTQSDRDAIAEVIASEKITEQQRVQSEGLASEWAEYMGVQYCIPVNSGTAALHLCVAGVGIEPGDEVIIPAFTFWATAAAVLHHNAIPVFVDIDPVTYCIDPNENRGEDLRENTCNCAGSYSRHARRYGSYSGDRKKAQPESY